MAQRVLLSLLMLPLFLGCAYFNNKNNPPVALEKRAKLIRNKESHALSREVRQLLKSRSNSNMDTIILGQKKSEEDMYSDIIQSYRLRDLEKIKLNVSQLISFYPNGIMADNAIYLLGQLHFKLGHYAEAAKAFDQVADNYKLGNKRASALLAKGQAYQKLRLFDLAADTFRVVERDYPGSPESYQVGMELKLIEVEQMNQ